MSNYVYWLSEAVSTLWKSPDVTIEPVIDLSDYVIVEDEENEKIIITNNINKIEFTKNILPIKKKEDKKSTKSIIRRKFKKNNNDKKLQTTAIKQNKYLTKSFDIYVKRYNKGKFGGR